MKLLQHLWAIPACAAVAVKRDGPHDMAAGGHGSTQAASTANPMSALLPFLSDIEPIAKILSPLIGRYLRSPEVVTGFMSKYLYQAPLGPTTDLKPLIRPNAKRKMFRYGPFKMFGQGQKVYTAISNGSIPSLDPQGQGWLFLIGDGLCKNCTILSGKPGLSFEDGTPANPENGFYVHHILTAEMKEPGINPVGPCDKPTVDPNSVSDIFTHPFFRGFLGNGADQGGIPIMFTSSDGKMNTGFQIGNSHQVLVQADFVNYTNKTTNVYMSLDVEYLEGHVGDAATTTLLSVTGCKVKAPDTNRTGLAVTQSQKFPILVDGALISAKGHLHDGGDYMVLSLNGREVCTSTAKYGEMGNIVSMPMCELHEPVKRGDYLSIKSVYDLKRHPLRKGVDGHSDSHNALGGVDVMGFFALTWSLDGDKKNTTTTHLPIRRSSSSRI